MSIMDRLVEVAASQRGFISARNSVDMGINPVELRKLLGRGRLQRVGHGLYRLAAFPHRANDDLMQAVLWTLGRGAISGASALALHDLCDINPRYINMTVPASYQPRRRGGEEYRIRRHDLAARDIEEVEDIPVVVPSRAITDAIEGGVDPRLVEQAITTAQRRGEIDEATGNMLHVLQESARSTVATKARR